jgi:hypothetical protein
MTKYLALLVTVGALGCQREKASQRAVYDYYAKSRQYVATHPCTMRHEYPASHVFNQETGEVESQPPLQVWWCDGIDSQIYIRVQEGAK